MSSHLRHCPKHRKPLPCAHCALAKPAQTPSTAVEPPPVIPTTGELLFKITLSKTLSDREKEAARGRERRKKRREQLAAIKLRLKTPVAELKRLAEEKKKQDEKPDSMNRGAFMTDAPQGKGLLVTGADLEGADRAAARTESLGPGVEPDEWPENDRKNIKPEGAGQRAGQRSFDEVEVSKNQNPYLADGVPQSNNRFEVKLGDIDRGQALINLSHSDLFARIDGMGLICRLCLGPFPERIEQHLEEVHGDEEDPKHDAQFGDVVAQEIKKIRRRRKKGGRSK